MDMDVEYLWLGLAIALLAIAFAVYIAVIMVSSTMGDRDSKKGRRTRWIANQIHDGSMMFLRKEYEVLVGFVGIMMAVLVYLEVIGINGEHIEKYTWLAFGFGAFLSALAGNIGMRIATAANGRTAYAVRFSRDRGLKIAFQSGAVMGLCVVGLGLAGLVIVYMALGDERLDRLEVLYGFGFGASSIALFARVGGGIYTKSADVGADLVGKVEAGIPEDDPRNPAVIADNVGDNVGDVAGMGADLFESYVDSIIAAMALGLSATVAVTAGGRTGTVAGLEQIEALTVPIIIASAGIIASILGILFTLSIPRPGNPRWALTGGTVFAAIMMVIFSYTALYLYVGEDGYNTFAALVTGLAAGVCIGFSTDYFTSDHQLPAKSIAKAATTGSGTVLISGMAVGMISVIVPVLVVCIAIMAAHFFADLYGIAIAALGMLSTLGVTLATDTYGPVADNAAGIAEMANLGHKARKRAEDLDAIGNTTAAVGKGFAIGSAALAALALFSAYTEVANLDGINIVKPEVITGLLIGALLPFVFSALTMNSVGRAAMAMVQEVRRQFREIKGLMTGRAQPDTKRCVAIATSAAIREMILPSVLVIAVPIAVGIWNAEALGGLLAGSLVTGFLLAVFMANAGGAWDNAKKYIEAGHHGGKGSAAHKAAVVGDTVGDPFKDTSGPSLNILIKLMAIVSLVFVPLFAF